MQSIGHPLFGDVAYGGAVPVKGRPGAAYHRFLDHQFARLPRQALHAKSLGFRHPTTGAWMHFDSELPADLLDVLAHWRTYLGADGHGPGISA
jgi:23S rRNA pseudouridine1911/1915/1917 synthase